MMDKNEEVRLSINDRKWAIEDPEYGTAVAVLLELYSEDGQDMARWKLVLNVLPYVVCYEQTVETFIEYLETNNAKKHWTVGA